MTDATAARSRRQLVGASDDGGAQVAGGGGEPRSSRRRRTQTPRCRSLPSARLFRGCVHKGYCHGWCGGGLSRYNTSISRRFTSGESGAVNAYKVFFRSPFDPGNASVAAAVANTRRRCFLHHHRHHIPLRETHCCCSKKPPPACKMEEPRAKEECATREERVASDQC